MRCLVPLTCWAGSVMLVAAAAAGACGSDGDTAPTGGAAGAAAAGGTTTGATGGAAATGASGGSAGAGGEQACSASLADVSQPLCDGVYDADVGATTFAAGSVVRALHPGKVRFTGSFEAGSDLTFRGIVIDNGGQKLLGAANLFEDMSFVGGPSCGNTVNAALGAGTTVRRSAFYGLGGRYQVLAYQVDGVTLEDVLIRSDGGWGEGGDGCNEWEPNAALNCYDSNDFVCRRCVLFDGIETASAESETLGGLGVNCHGTASNMLFEGCLITRSQGGFWADGNGTCANVTVVDGVARQSGAYGIHRNVDGTTAATRLSTDGGCGVWAGSITLVDSAVAGTNDGCTGSVAGGGANSQLDTDFLDDARWRTEMCDEAGVTRGWCATSQPLSAYLSGS